MIRKPMLILGVGNTLLQDEGVGVHAVNAINACLLPPGTDVLDGGTAGLWLMSALQGYDTVIIVDATCDGNAPGFIRTTTPALSVDTPSLRTVHEVGVQDLITAMTLNGYCPAIYMVLVSITQYDTLGTSLTRPVTLAMPSVLSRIYSLASTIARHHFSGSTTLSFSPALRTIER